MRYREEEKDEMEKKQQEENKENSTASEEVKEVSLDETNEVKEETQDFEKEELIAEVNKYKDLYLRTLADTENYKKRINEERIRERKYFNQSLIEKFVNALDIFDKTISIKTDDEKLKNFLIGFEMINNNLKQILIDEGVSLIESVGKQFDPSVHHAIETGYDETKEEGIILEEIQRGYKFKDRVLRAALVKVNKKNKEEN